MFIRILSRIGSFFKGLWSYGMRHKIQAAIVVLVVIGLGYWGYTAYAKNITTTQYVLSSVRLGPIQQTVTGSGQVASQHQLNLSPKTGGTLTSVDVKEGDQVVAGQTIATVDDTDAENSLVDAENSFEGAKLAYEQAQTTNTNTVQKSVDEVFTTSAGAYSDMGTILSGINSIMQGNEVSGSYTVKNVYAYSAIFNNSPDIVSYRDKLINDYTAADAAYESALTDYNATSRSADPATAQTLADETYSAEQSVTQAAKDLNDYLNQVSERISPTDTSRPAILTTHLSSSATYLSTMNTDTSSMETAKNDIASSIQTSGSSSMTISQEQTQLDYQKAQQAYQEAEDTLANYVVTAPFAGTIASVALQEYDTAGSGTTVAVLITKEQYATLSLNEVDASKIAVGQKASLTFEAISGLTIQGTVAEVDQVGTVSQGVVSYAVKIGFDTQDARVLPGMTVNATIVTASKDSTIVVPSSAIKTSGTSQYVQVATFTSGNAPSAAGRGSSASSTATTTRRANFGTSTAAFTGSSTGSSTFAGRTGSSGGSSGLTVDASQVTLKNVPITTGITNDTETEITSGLTPGEFIVTQSLNSSGKSTQTKSILSIFGGSGGSRTTTGTGAAAAGGGGSFRAGGGGGGAAVLRAGG